MTTTTMRRLLVSWLPLALAVLVTSRCAIGSPTRSQLRQIITMILFEDELYDDVLSEKVKLKKSNELPPCFGEAIKDINNIDPLASLRALSTPQPLYYSGDNLNLSLIIVMKSLTCLMHKRVAFHLGLIIGLFQNKDNRENFKTRIHVFTYAIPFFVDMVSSINGDYDKLLTVYDLVHRMLTLDIAEDATFEENIGKLKTELISLSNFIEQTCVVHNMKEYCSSFKLDKLENCEKSINEENIISGLDVNIYIATLMENENDIMNLFEEMDWLRFMDMNAWRVWLNAPKDLKEIPIEEFIRTPLPKHRDEIEDILEARKHAMEKEKVRDKSGPSDAPTLG